MVISACKCNGCNCYKLFNYTCVVCLFTCLFVLTCCGYCIYKVSSLQTIDTSVSSNKCDTNIPSTQDASPREQQSGDLKYYEETRVKRDKGTRHTEVKQESESSENRNKLNEKGENTKTRRNRKKKSKRRKKTMVAHYTLQSGIPDPGVVCPVQKTETSKTPNLYHLKRFTAAPFVQEKTNPFLHSNGLFIVKNKGLYLVYAQIIFEDCRESQVMILQQKRNDVTIQEHFCVTGVKQSNIKYNNTCSITVLFHLEKNDVVSMENYLPEVHINYRSYNNTFIGAVLID